jgi:hypothetical protein
MLKTNTDDAQTPMKGIEGKVEKGTKTKGAGNRTLRAATKSKKQA